MPTPKSSIWKDALKPGIPDLPALISDSASLWLCYAVAPSSLKRFAIVQFIEVIDYRLSPINDEGIGQHPYCEAGLEFYSFNEITGSAESVKWSARHWVVTFKDNTLDVIARDAKVVASDLQALSPMSALLGYKGLQQK